MGSRCAVMFMWSSGGRAWKAVCHAGFPLDLAGTASTHGSGSLCLTGQYVCMEGREIAGDVTHAVVPKGRCSPCGSARLGMLCLRTESLPFQFPSLTSSSKILNKKTPLKRSRPRSQECKRGFCISPTQNSSASSPTTHSETQQADMYTYFLKKGHEDISTL